MKTYTIPKYGITVQVMTNNGKQAGTIKSELREAFVGSDLEGDTGEFYAVVDTIESLLLAHACAGLDIGSEVYVAGLNTAIEAIANNL
jgi:hypothetical protein